MPPMYNRPEFVTMFLEKYKSLPSLWNKKYPGSTDRKQREKDYWDLFRLYKQNHQEATLRNMKSKLNSWFIVFRKEYSKQRESLEAGEDPPYEPSIWYFKNLLFLAENDSIVMNGQPRIPRHNPDLSTGAPPERFEEVFMPTSDAGMSMNSKRESEAQWKEAKDHLRQVKQACPDVIQLQTSKSRPCLIIDGYRYRFKRTNKEGVAIWLCMKDRSAKCLGKVVTQNGIITPTTPHVCGKDEDNQKKMDEEEDWPPVPPPSVKKKSDLDIPSVVFDEFEIIGKDVAAKLRKMTEEQRIYAELLISQTVVCGTSGRLTENTTLTHVKPKEEHRINDTFHSSFVDKAKDEHNIHNSFHF